MIRAKSILATLAAGLALSGGAALVSSGESRNSREMSGVPETKILLAQAAPEQPAAPSGSAAPGPRTSLGQAVGIAEKQTGGRAVSAGMRQEKGSYVYSVKTLAKDKSAKVLVDPASGNVMRVDEPGFIARIASVFDRDDQWQEQVVLAALEASPMTLAGAVAAAEKDTGGRAVRARSTERYGSVLFEVRLLKDGAMLAAQVDAASGKVATLPMDARRNDDD
jgi:uncharacterized membrane protein YkoI